MKPPLGQKGTAIASMPHTHKRRLAIKEDLQGTSGGHFNKSNH